jgi:Pectate lyase superfamily protein
MHSNKEIVKRSIFLLFVGVAWLPACGSDASGTEDAGTEDAGMNSNLDGATADASSDADAGPAQPDGSVDGSVPTCTLLTDQQLLDIGYEPVRAHGAVGDGVHDDTVAIQEAIDEANRVRRVVYLHPGTYLVSDTLELRQDVYQTLSNNGVGRFGQMLLGSYCGAHRPTIRLADGTATETDEQAIAAEPLPVVLLWRASSASSPGPDDTDGSRDWNQVVRNVHIVLGNNPGAVGIRHGGAEGCSAQEVTIDATGGFAGLYNLNGSGGYTYNVEVVGGKYGIYQEHSRGGSTLVVGLRLSGQVETPIAIGGYTPFGLVGFEIIHDDGQIISSISGPETAHTVPGELRTAFHDSGGHVFLVDGSIEITGTDNTEILSNTTRSVYLKNVHVKGRTDVLANSATSGTLQVTDNSLWMRISEFSYSGPYTSLYGEPGHLIQSAPSDDTYYDGVLLPASDDTVVSEQQNPPPDLITRHLYREGLCNVEASGNVFVTDHGADPNDEIDDTAAINAAIDAAKSGSNNVFLSGSHADPASGALSHTYLVSGTLNLGSQTTLCGVTRYSSVLSATAWSPSSDSPVLATPDDVNATTAIADFKILIPSSSGYQANGNDPQYDPHVYALLWRAGRGSLYRDVYAQRAWGDPGKTRVTVITGNGGGRWYGVTQHGGYPPPDVDPGPDEDRPFTDGSGNLKMSPLARQMLILSTHEQLDFYPYHCQHMTQPRAALVEIRDASNVHLYGIKSEMGSVPERMSVIVQSNPPELVPVWMYIINSNNIWLTGHEGLSQTGADRSLIELTQSSDVTIASMGRRGNGVVVGNAALPQDQWYFVKDDSASGSNSVTAQGFVALYKSW